MKKKQMLKTFVLIWTFSLVISLAATYGGMLGFSISPYEPVDIIAGGELLIEQDYGVVQAGDGILPVGELTVTVTIKQYSVQDLRCYLKDTDDNVLAEDLTVEWDNQYPDQIHTFSIDIEDIISTRTDVYLSFKGEHMDYNWVGESYTFFIDPELDTMPTGTETTTTITPTNGLPLPIILPDSPEAQMARTGFAVMIILVHLVVLPIGIFAIGKRPK